MRHVENRKNYKEGARHQVRIREYPRLSNFHSNKSARRSIRFVKAGLRGCEWQYYPDKCVPRAHVCQELLPLPVHFAILNRLLDRKTPSAYSVLLQL